MRGNSAAACHRATRTAPHMTPERQQVTLITPPALLRICRSDAPIAERGNLLCNRVLLVCCLKMGIYRMVVVCVIANTPEPIALCGIRSMNPRISLEYIRVCPENCGQCCQSQTELLDNFKVISFVRFSSN